MHLHPPATPYFRTQIAQGRPFGRRLIWPVRGSVIVIRKMTIHPSRSSGGLVDTRVMSFFSIWNVANPGEKPYSTRSDHGAGLPSTTGLKDGLRRSGLPSWPFSFDAGRRPASSSSHDMSPIPCKSDHMFSPLLTKRSSARARA
jgi:hypothetical protein